ncbi:FUSC family protein [Glycomyces albidus]|nr:FUSC family protein [Glycomyces albidus]
MDRYTMISGVRNDLRGAWGFAREAPRRGTWARETVVQAFKAGVAAMLAWFVAAYLLRLPMPYLAPWVALAVVRPTVHWSVLTGLRQVAAVALGVLIAVGSAALMPGRELALAMCVPVAFLVGYWPRLDDQGLYVPFTALFMVAVDSVEEPFVLFRLLETGLGAAIGMGVNLLVAPPVRVLTVDARARRDGEETAAVLREFAARLRGDDGDEPWSTRARDLDQRAGEARSALQHARDSLRLNPRQGEAWVRESIESAGAAFDLIRRVNRSVRAVADILDDSRRDGIPDPALDAGFSRECASFLDTAADTCERRVTELLGSADGEPADDLSGALEALEQHADSGAEAQAALLIALRRLALDLNR